MKFKYSILLVCSLFGIIVLTVFKQGSASAAYTATDVNGLLPSGMTQVYNAETGCHDRLYATTSGTTSAKKRANVNASEPYILYNYISKDGDRSVDQFEVPYGDKTAINLQFNQLNFICAILVGTNQNNDRFSVNTNYLINNTTNARDGAPVRAGTINYTSLDGVHTEVVSNSIIQGSGTISGINGGVSAIAFSSTSRYWLNTPLKFTFTPKYPLASQKVIVRLQVRAINSYGSNDFCVSGGGAVASSTSFASCTSTPVDVSFYIKAQPYVTGAKIDDTGVSSAGTASTYGGNLVFDGDKIATYTDSTKTTYIHGSTSNPYYFKDNIQLPAGSTYITDIDANSHPGWILRGYSYCYTTTFVASTGNWKPNTSCDSAYLTSSINIKSGTGVTLDLKDGDEIAMRWIYAQAPIVDGSKVEAETGATGGFADNTVNILNSGNNVINTTNANPYSFTVNSKGASSASYSSTQSAAGASDGSYVPIGYTFCDEATATCTAAYSNASANIQTSGTVTMVAGHRYRLNWLYKSYDICSLTTLSGNTAEEGTPLQIQINIDFSSLPSALQPGTNNTLSFIVNGTTYTPILYGMSGGRLTSSVLTISLPFGDYNGTVNLTGPSTPFGSINCINKPVSVVRHPYFRAFGADIYSGGSFKDSTGVCPALLPTNGKLIGYFDQVNHKGAGGQLASIAVLAVSGVASAAVYNPLVNTADNMLTFANDAASYPPGQMGGNFQMPYCAPDYYDDEKASPTSVGTASVDLSTYTDNQQTQINGNVTFVAANHDIRHTFFVTGDVYISGTISYTGITPTSVDTIPYLTIIAKGNIYIDPSVTHLSGLYIAQPDTSRLAPTGLIKTCSSSAGALPANPAVDCNRQLIVDGAFIAKKVALQRTYGTLNQSTPQELNTSTSHAAEIFQTSPSMYIGRPVFKQSNSLYDSIKGLPPTL